MILQGAGQPISCLGVCYVDKPQKGGPYGVRAYVWEACKAGVPGFKYKDISFAVHHGVLHWINRKSRWVPVTTQPSSNSKRCMKQGLSGDAVHP